MPSLLSSPPLHQPLLSLSEVTADIAAIRLSIVNAYLVGPRDAPNRGWFLVDAGLPFSAETILAAAAKRFGPESRPSAIVLTHGHFDHVGALPQLADEWQVPVYCHPLEVPYLTGWSSYPPPDPTVGGLMGFLSRFFPRGPEDLGDRVIALPEDGTVPGASEWRWIPTPGHAPGHVSLFRESDRALIVGDAFVTVAQESAWSVLSQFPAVRRPPPYWTTDWEADRQSVQRLSDLQPNIATTGHGPALSGDVLRQGLNRLLEDWSTHAVPHGCRYSDRPARSDDRGTVWVPPAVRDRRLEALILCGAFLAAWQLLKSHS